MSSVKTNEYGRRKFFVFVYPPINLKSYKVFDRFLLIKISNSEDKIKHYIYFERFFLEKIYDSVAADSRIG
jgi:hypothetical protein